MSGLRNECGPVPPFSSMLSLGSTENNPKAHARSRPFSEPALAIFGTFAAFLGQYPRKFRIIPRPHEITAGIGGDSSMLSSGPYMCHVRPMGRAASEPLLRAKNIGCRLPPL